MTNNEHTGFGGGWIYETYDFGNAYICPIGRVDVGIIRSMNTRGLCRIDSCVLFDEHGNRLFADEDMEYAADYLGEDNLIASVARYYDISHELVNIVEQEY
ncbi:MAG: hypothetical protein IJ072_01495 [Oscillospiraceae bacterium]|nr:hypothetical protein [Oscillospiraceae bacterium]